MKCCFCGEDAGKYGHNPEPLKSSPNRCCDDCNSDLVITARLKLWKEGKEYSG